MKFFRLSRCLFRVSASTQHPTRQITRRRAYATKTKPVSTVSPENPNVNFHQEPTPPPKQPSRVGAFYTTFTRPLTITFLTALLTYQLTYYVWLKLEALEEAHDKEVEIAALKGELRDALERQKRKVVEGVEEVGERVKDGLEQAVTSVKEGTEEVGKATGVVGRVASGGWWPW